MPTTILFNKPFGVICQFSGEGNPPTLARYIDVPNVYPAGRLDKDSEGLVLLTDDGNLQSRVSKPGPRFGKTYWAQVERIPEESDLDKLRNGILLKDGKARPTQCKLIDEPNSITPRSPPIRVRKHIPDCWLEITLHEGRNRQVRRMCAAIGFPVLRLVRYSIGSWTLDGLAPGKYQKV